MKRRLIIAYIVLFSTFCINGLISFLYNSMNRAHSGPLYIIGAANLALGGIFVAGLIFMGIYLFIHVAYLMYKKHRYEFNRVKCCNLLFFSLMIL